MDRQCENCRQSHYVHDTNMDEWICSTCGVVVRGWWEPGECNQNFTTTPDDIATNSTDKVQNTTHRQLMEKAYPREKRHKERKSVISTMCRKLDVVSTVETRALLIYEHHNAELNTLKPRKKMLLACVIVACRSSEHSFVPMSTVRGMYYKYCNGIKKYTDAVCNIIGLNQNAFSLKAVPYVTHYLRLPFKCQKVMIETYEKVCIIAPAVAPETRLAITACKVLNDHGKEIDYDLVAFATDASQSSIKTFLEKNKQRNT
jgi:hypothetical protein